MEKPEQTTFYIVKNENDRYVTHGFVQPGQTMRTGQPVLETYPTEQAWLEALEVLGVDPNETFQP